MQIVLVLLGLVQVASESGLSAAVATADPGDVIEIQAGSYAVNLVLTRDGTADQPITLRAASGQIVVLSARDSALRTIDLQSASHWRLQGLKVRGSRHANIRIEGGTDNVIEDCEIYDGTKKGIIANGDLITIRDSTIRDIKQPLGGQDTQGIAAWRASRLRIHDNFIATPGDGVLIGGAGELTRVSTDVRIYDNHFHTRTAWQGVYHVENAIDVKAAEAMVIADNEIHRYDDHAQMDGGVAILLQTHDEGAPDVRIDGVRVERNEIYDVGRAISIQSVHGPGRNVDFRRNVVYAVREENMDDGKHPGGVVAGDWTGVDVDHNTFVDVENAWVRGWGNLSGLRARNNVIRRSGGFVTEGVSAVIDYSCRYSAPETAGTHDVVAPQLFVDDSGRDYRLTASSPCIDAGLDVGLTYEGNRPDIGRYEWAGSASSARLAAPDEGAAPSPAPSDGRAVDWAKSQGEPEHVELGPELGEGTGPGDGTAMLEDVGPAPGRDPTVNAGTTDGLVGGCQVGRRGKALGLTGIAVALLWTFRSIRRRRGVC